MLALGRRAAACTEVAPSMQWDQALGNWLPVWQILPGMLVRYVYFPDRPPVRVLRVSGGVGFRATMCDGDSLVTAGWPALIPDFADELTRMGALSLVRKSWGRGTCPTRAPLEFGPERRCCLVLEHAPPIYRPTDIEAWVVALEMAAALTRDWDAR